MTVPAPRSRTHRLENRANVLYRMYDADGVLLYIGITTNLEDRLADHRGFKGWWREVSTIKLEHFPTRSSAEDAERLAIETEVPRWNVRHGVSPAERSTPASSTVSTMRHRNFRIEDEIWIEATRIAELRGERLSQVLRDEIKREIAKYQHLIADDPVLAQRIADLRAKRKSAVSPTVEQQERA